jgi:hypothetical protein
MAGSEPEPLRVLPLNLIAGWPSLSSLHGHRTRMPLASLVVDQTGERCVQRTNRTANTARHVPCHYIAYFDCRANSRSIGSQLQITFRDPAAQLIPVRTSRTDLLSRLSCWVDQFRIAKQDNHLPSRQRLKQLMTRAGQVTDVHTLPLSLLHRATWASFQHSTAMAQSSSARITRR